MYKYIKDDSNFYDLAFALSDTRATDAYCDLETTGLDPRLSKILLFQIMVNDEIYIFDFLHLNNDHLKYLVNLLKTTNVRTTFHNTKFDLKFLAHNTGEWLNNNYDTMNAEVLLNAGLGKSTYSLKDLAMKYAGIELNKDARATFFEGEVQAITDQMLQYSAMDVKVLKDIHCAQMELLQQAKEMKVLNLEMQLLPAIAKMEYDGVLIDSTSWLELDAKERARLDRVTEVLLDSFIKEVNVAKFPDALELAKVLSIPVKTKKAQNLARTITTPDTIAEWMRQNFNLASPLQLKSALNYIGVDVASTDKKVLKKLEQSEVVKALLEKSECAKRISTYGATVLDNVNPISGRIHTEFLDMGTATGRLSSGNPINLQNIPNAPGYRESFIARPDYVWLSHDYSQQEFRLTGAVTGEPKIIEAYQQGADMHTATASIIYNKPLKDIEKKERFVGKTANFAILYGGTEYTLGKNLGLSQEKALEILEDFKRGFPVFTAFKEAAENMIIKLGFSTTKLGRRRYMTPKPLYQTANEYVRWVNRQKREGFNHIIQGGAADITKIAMVNIYNKNPFGDKFRLLIQVHDELDSEAHKSIWEDAREFVKEEMLAAEQPFLKDIPAAVDSQHGEYWKH